MNKERELSTGKIGTLMGHYAVPCILSLLVGALYNIVDQIFIANASYLGSYGNAANTVVFPLTVIALGIAVMIGDGCCAFVSISLGEKKPENAAESVGNSILLCILSGLLLTAVYLLFSDPILTAFGGRVNEETFAFSKEYFFWITLGIPFYLFDQKMPQSSSPTPLTMGKNTMLGSAPERYILIWLHMAAQKPPYMANSSTTFTDTLDAFFCITESAFFLMNSMI